MRENAHITKRNFNGVQLRVTIPRHIAQAVGIWSNGFIAYHINDRGQIVITPHPEGVTANGNAPNLFQLDRPTTEPAPG